MHSDELRLQHMPLIILFSRRLFCLPACRRGRGRIRCCVPVSTNKHGIQARRAGATGPQASWCAMAMAQPLGEVWGF